MMKYFKIILSYLTRFIPDKLYLKIIFYYRLGYRLNLKNPKTYNEKLNWLKLYDRNPLYTKLVDKYEVKNYINNIAGEKHIIPTLGVYNSFDEIDFSKLPKQFVLKCTHDSGGLIIVKDKKNLDIKDARKKFKKWLKNSHFLTQREWAYKNVKPRIIAEEYIDSLGKPESIEYKLTCFDGKANLITLCKGIAHDSFDKRFNDFYDRDLNPLDFCVFYKNSPKRIPIPKEINEIISFCEKISEGIPCVRVDVYLVDGKIKFGEMTFYTWGGFCVFEPKEWDRKLGDLIKLPNKKYY